MDGALPWVVTIAAAWGLFVYWNRQRLLLAFRQEIVIAPFRPVPADALSAELRDALGRRSEPLVGLGFVPVGFCERAHPRLVAPERVLALVHPETGTVATVCVGTVGAQLGTIVIFRTKFVDGSWLRTTAGRAHLYWGEIPGGRYVDVLTADVGELWRAHRTAVLEEKRDVVVDTSLEAAIALENSGDESQRRWLLEHGHASLTEDPEVLQATALGARALADKFRAGASRVARSPLAKAAPSYATTPPEEMERYFLVRERVRLRVAGSQRRASLFIVTGLLFALPAALSPTLRELLWLLPAVVIHELGHFVAMRLLGHRDARIFFVPFLGAATATDKPYKKLWHEMVVLLAGPLPGLLTLPLVLVIRRPWLLHAQMAMIGLSVINLLPIYPLDGGRIVRALLTAGHPRRDMALRVLGVAAFLGWGVRGGDPAGLIIGAFMAWVFWRGRGTAALEATVRARLSPDDRGDPKARRFAIYRVLASHPEPAALEGRLALVNELDRRLVDDPPSFGRALPWLIIYAAPLAFLGALFALPHTNFMSWLAASRRHEDCPSVDTAVPIACVNGEADVAAVDWSSTPPLPPKMKVRPSKGEAEALFRCRGPASPALTQLQSGFDELVEASEYCPAPPWQPAPTENEEKSRTVARATYRTLMREVEGMWDDGPTTAQSQSRAMQAFDAAVAKARAGSEPFDAETAGLVREVVADDFEPNADTRAKLRVRLGGPAGTACETPRFSRATVRSDKDHPGAATLLLGVTYSSTASLAPLASYLCRAGCALNVTPYASHDYRVYTCD